MIFIHLFFKNINSIVRIFAEKYLSIIFKSNAKIDALAYTGFELHKCKEWNTYDAKVNIFIPIHILKTCTKTDIFTDRTLCKTMP